MLLTPLMCMALAIHVESRGEPTNGKLAVASVIMNRVETNSTDVCDEITKPYQFPWARKKIKKTPDGYVLQKNALPKDKAWESSYQLAIKVMEGNFKRLPKIAFFHSVYENPRWRLRMAYRIGNHIFYYA